MPILDLPFCTVLIPAFLTVHVVWILVVWLRLIALGNVARVYPGIVQVLCSIAKGIMKILAYVVQVLMPLL